MCNSNGPLKAFIVVGAESSGTKLVTSILIAGGCVGSSNDEQEFDTQEFGGANPVVIRRSVPHLKKYGGLNWVIDKCVTEGYDYHVVVCVRERSAMASSQVKRGHVENIDKAIDHIDIAYREIFSNCERYTIVSYESLVLHPAETQESLQRELELNVSTVRVTDENVKHYERLPMLAVLTPFRNARRNLKLYFNQFLALRDELAGEYQLRLVAAEGDSVDGTRKEIVRLANEHKVNLELVDASHGHMSWGSVEDPTRLECMSNVMNAALDRVRDSDDMVLWIMSDLEWEVKTIQSLLDGTRLPLDYYSISEKRTGKSIFAPMVFTKGTDIFWDLWAYRDTEGERFRQEPPYGKGLLLNETLLAYGYKDFPEIYSAGTCLMIPAEVARTCRADKDEVVSFCADVRSRGHKVRLVPSSIVYHRQVTNKRLLFLGDINCATGFARCTHALLPELAAAEFDIDVIGIGYFGEPHDRPYRIWPAAVPPGKHLMGQMQLYRHLISGYYDVVIIQCDVWNGQLYLGALRQAHLERPGNDPGIVIGWVPVDAANQRAAEELNYETLPDGEVLRGFDHVVCWTDFARQELTTRGYTGDLSVIPLGVDLERFKPVTPASRKQAREIFLPEECRDGFIIYAVARNQRRKRLDLLLDAFAAFVKNYDIDDAYLLIHSLPSNPPGSVNLGEYIEFLELRDRVLESTSNNLPDEFLALKYHVADIFCTTTMGEGWGLPIIEAMASGVPAVVPSLPSLCWADNGAYFVECSGTDLVAPMNDFPYTVGGIVDTVELAETFHRLYTNRDELKKLSARGLALARSLPWDKTAREVATLVAQLHNEQLVVKAKVEDS